MYNADTWLGDWHVWTSLARHCSKPSHVEVSFQQKSIHRYSLIEKMVSIVKEIVLYEDNLRYIFRHGNPYLGPGTF